MTLFGVRLFLIVRLSGGRSGHSSQRTFSAVTEAIETTMAVFKVKTKRFARGKVRIRAHE
jgi:hypothetical protein